MALLALRSHSNGRRHSLSDPDPTFALRLLIAGCCQNTTSQGLTEGLDRFPNLAFLDLSNTLAARDRNVLWKLGDLPLLQVLKLRGVHLRDEDVDVLADAIGIKVRSLDVQGNHLTDHSVRTLLTSCFQADNDTNTSSNGRPRAISNLAVEDWPAGFVRPDPAILDEFKDESYDERFVRRLTSSVVSRLPYEDMPHSGITHLYIANNKLTVEGLAALIRSGKLHVLDAGSVDRFAHGPLSEASPSLSPFDARHIRLPGVEKLTPFLTKHAQGITSLRLHHAVITKDTPLKDEGSPVAPCELGTGETKHELNGLAPNELDAAVYELDATPPLYELEMQEPQPRYELPGDPTHFYVSPPIGDKPGLSTEESQPEARRGSIFAPESLEPQESDEDTAPVLTATGLGSVAQGVNGVNGPNQVKGVTRNDRVEVGKESAQMRVTLIHKQRQELRSSRLDKPHGLTPGMLPKLRTLTLTNVPCFDSTGRVVETLIQFIKDCASEAELANLQARLEVDPVRKPGERHSKHNRHTAREIFALRQIALEMAPAISPVSPNQSSKLVNRTKSSTEDADSEAFWSAAENDFTFFDNNEECGLPSIDTDTYVPTSALSEKMMMPADGFQLDILPTLKTTEHKEAPVDVVQQLARFRKGRKTTYENAVGRGLLSVDGHWPGEVKVVRGHHTGGKMDYYGNHFEKGGVYR
ncbi:MAG: hypothetical protein ASARMPREDX12_002126 [Alectoria sarmentosa]|nr:MAG: hypothetical protein ASARMPREDX12_002126 [Alectoria sarmentosa]